jgi:hypothetical protein
MENRPSPVGLHSRDLLTACSLWWASYATSLPASNHLAMKVFCDGKPEERQCSPIEVLGGHVVFTQEFLAGDPFEAR